MLAIILKLCRACNNVEYKLAFFSNYNRFGRKIERQIKRITNKCPNPEKL